jgi:hypothetical protein
MKNMSRRLRRLETSFAPKRNEQGQTVVEVLLARQARRVANESGRPYEQVYQEILIEHQARSQAFWADYKGNGMPSDIINFGRSRRFEAMAATGKAAHSM